MEQMNLDYFHGSENEQYLFYQMPVMLFKDSRFRELSDSAKILYSFLLNRTSLSAKNDWRDNEGRVYIIYTIAQIAEDLNCWEQKAQKSLKELKEIGLIKTVRQGLTKPNLIYVMNFATEYKYQVKDTEKEPKTTENPLNNENRYTEKMKNTKQKITESPTNYIDLSQNNFKKTDISIISSEIKAETSNNQPVFDKSDIDTIDNTTIKSFSAEEIADKISLPELKAEYPTDRHEEINIIYDILREVLDNPIKTHFRISKQNIPLATVNPVFDKIEKSHIEYVLKSLSNNDNKYKITKNTHNYITTALFHAPRTIDYYFKKEFEKPRSEKISKSFDVDDFFAKAVRKSMKIN